MTPVSPGQPEGRTSVRYRRPWWPHPATANFYDLANSLGDSRLGLPFAYMKAQCDIWRRRPRLTSISSVHYAHRDPLGRPTRRDTRLPETSTGSTPSGAGQCCSWTAQPATIEVRGRRPRRHPGQRVGPYAAINLPQFSSPRPPTSSIPRIGQCHDMQWRFLRVPTRRPTHRAAGRTAVDRPRPWPKT